MSSYVFFSFFFFEVLHQTLLPSANPWATAILLLVSSQRKKLHKQWKIPKSVILIRLATLYIKSDLNKTAYFAYELTWNLNRKSAKFFIICLFDFNFNIFFQHWVKFIACSQTIKKCSSNFVLKKMCSLSKTVFSYINLIENDFFGFSCTEGTAALTN